MPQSLTQQQWARKRAQARALLPTFMPESALNPSANANDINKMFSGQGNTYPIPSYPLKMDAIIPAQTPPLVFHPQMITHPEPTPPRRTVTSPRSHPSHQTPIVPRSQPAPMSAKPSSGMSSKSNVPARKPSMPTVSAPTILGLPTFPHASYGAGQPLLYPVRNFVPHPTDNPFSSLSPNGYAPSSLPLYGPSNRPSAPAPPPPTTQMPPEAHPSFRRQMFDNTFGTGKHRGDFGQLFHGLTAFPGMILNAAGQVVRGGVAAGRGTYYELHGNYADSQRQAQIADDSWHHTRDTIGGMLGANEGGWLNNLTTAAAQYDGGDTEGAQNTVKGMARDAALHPLNTVMAVLPVAGAGLLGKAAALERAAEAASGARKVQLLEDAAHYRNLAQGGKPGQLVRNAAAKVKAKVMADPTGRRIVQNTNYVAQEATNAANAINNFKNPLPPRPVKPKPGMTLADTGKPTTVDINGRPVAAPLSKDSSWQAHMDAEVQKNQAQLKEKGVSSQAPTPDVGVQNSFGWPFKAKKTHESSVVTPGSEIDWSSSKRYDLKDAMFVTDHGIPSVLVPEDLYKMYHASIGSKGFNATKGPIARKYAHIDKDIKDDTAKIAEYNKDPTNVENVKKASDLIDLNKRRQTLLDTITAANEYNPTSMSWIRMGGPAKRIFATRRHEDVHYAQLLLGKGSHKKVLSNAEGSPQRFKNNPHYAEARKKLLEIYDGYDGMEHAEIPAFIGGGQHSLLGLTDEEAASLIEDYVRDLADQHDWEGVERVFRNSHEVAKNAADTVLSTHPNKPMPPTLPQAQQSWFKLFMSNIKGSRAP